MWFLFFGVGLIFFVLLLIFMIGKVVSVFLLNLNFSFFFMFFYNLLIVVFCFDLGIVMLNEVIIFFFFVI